MDVEDEGSARSVEAEERLQLNAPLFEAPGYRHGTANKRPRAGSNLRASKPVDAGGPSMRAERRAVDKASVETPAQRAARIKSMLTSKQLDAQSPTRKRQALVQGAPDFRWRIDKESGEASYVSYINPNAIGWESK